MVCRGRSKNNKTCDPKGNGQLTYLQLLLFWSGNNKRFNNQERKIEISPENSLKPDFTKKDYLNYITIGKMVNITEFLQSQALLYITRGSKVFIKKLVKIQIFPYSYL